MAVSPELEQKMNKLSELNMRVCNIYSEMTANSRKYIDAIFSFNETASHRAKRMAVCHAHKCFSSNEELKIELEKAQKEASTLSDEVTKMMIEEQEDFVNQIFDYEKGV